MRAGTLVGSRDVGMGVCWVVFEGSLVLFVAVGIAVRWAVGAGWGKVRAQDRGGLDVGLIPSHHYDSVPSIMVTLRQGSITQRYSQAPRIETLPRLGYVLSTS